MKIKRLFICLISAVALFAFAFSGCEYHAAQSAPGTNAGTGGSSSGGGGTDSEDGTFTVTLVYEDSGAAFYYTDGMTAQWRDMNSNQVYEAQFTAFNNTVSISGLDGDYYVTITGLDNFVSDTYTYDSNAYTATNDNPDVTINIVSLKSYTKNSSHDGTMYKAYELSSIGVYRATIEGPDDVIYFLYKPTESGDYGVQSWVNASEDLINPQVRYYTGSSSFAGSYTLYDDGGVENTYTKNFSFSIQLTDDMVGGGFRFAILAQAKNEDLYPVTIDFALTLNGEYTIDSYEYEYPYAEEFYVDLTAENEVYDAQVAAREEKMQAVAEKYNQDKAAGTQSPVVSSGNIFDEELVELREDGYYYYVGTDSRVYAAINVADYVGIYGTALINIDTESDPLRFVNTSGEAVDYNLFVQGALACYTKEKVDASGNFRYTGHYYSEDVYTWGYSDGATYCDGYYPVTEELKNFLQEFCVAKKLFADGGGYCEGQGYSSYDNSMWLLFCCYYA